MGQGKSTETRPIRVHADSSTFNVPPEIPPNNKSKTSARFKCQSPKRESKLPSPRPNSPDQGIGGEELKESPDLALRQCVIDLKDTLIDPAKGATSSWDRADKEVAPKIKAIRMAINNYFKENMQIDVAKSKGSILLTATAVACVEGDIKLFAQNQNLALRAGKPDDLMTEFGKRLQLLIDQPTSRLGRQSNNNEVSWILEGIQKEFEIFSNNMWKMKRQQ